MKATSLLLELKFVEIPLFFFDSPGESPSILWQKSSPSRWRSPGRSPGDLLGSRCEHPCVARRWWAPRRVLLESRRTWARKVRMASLPVFAYMMLTKMCRMYNIYIMYICIYTSNYDYIPYVYNVYIYMYVCSVMKLSICIHNYTYTIMYNIYIYIYIYAVWWYLLRHLAAGWKRIFFGPSK